MLDYSLGVNVDGFEEHIKQFIKEKIGYSEKSLQVYANKLEIFDESKVCQLCTGMILTDVSEYEKEKVFRLRWMARQFIKAVDKNICGEGVLRNIFEIKIDDSNYFYVLRTIALVEDCSVENLNKLLKA